MNQSLLYKSVIIALSTMLTINANANETVKGYSEPSVELAPITIYAVAGNSIDSSFPTVNKVSAESLNNPSVNDLASALQNQTSISIDTNKDGDVSFMSIRGMGENNTDVKIDGIDVPSYLTYGHNSFNTGELNSVEMETLKEIDIVKGHQSAKQDGSALAGSINLRTYRPSDFVNTEDPTYASIKSGYSSKNDGLSNTLTGAYASGNLSGMIIYTNRNYHELDNMGADENKTLRNEADYQQNNVLLKGELDVANATLIATGEWFDYEKETNPRYSKIVNYKEPSERKRFSLEGEFDNVLGFDEIYTNLAYQQSSNSSRGWSNYSKQFYRGDFEQDYVGVSADAVKNINVAGINHGLVFGLGYNQKDFSFERVEETSGFITRRIPSTTRDTAFAYLKDNIKFNNGVVVAPGVRVEHKKLDFEADDLLKKNPVYKFRPLDSLGSETKVLPSVNLIAPVSDNFKFYASYAEGSKTSDDANFVTYGHPRTANNPRGFVMMPNPDLEDEESKNIEFGVSYQTENMDFNLNAFYTDYDDFISGKTIMYKGNSAYMPFNIKDVKTQGIELNSHFKVHDHLMASLGATWIDAESQTDGSDEVPLINTTPFVAVAGLTYSPNDKWGTDLRVKVASQGRNPENDKKFRTAGYGLTDIGAWWKPKNNLTLSGGVYNVFDKKYWNATDVNGDSRKSYSGSLVNFDPYTMPGRNYGIKFKYEF